MLLCCSFSLYTNINLSSIPYGSCTCMFRSEFRVKVEGEVCDATIEVKICSK